MTTTQTTMLAEATKPEAAADPNGTTSLEISVDLEALKIGDLRTLDGEGRTTGEMINLLEKVVTGGVRHLPVRFIRAIGQAMQAEMAALTGATGDEATAAAAAIPLPEGVSLDIDRLTIGDLELLDEEGRSTADMISLLGKVVVGAKIEDLAVKYLGPISARLRAEMDSMADLGN